MIYEFNIVLMVVVGILIVATLHRKREGFDEFDFDSNPYIPYVSQDLMCMILYASNVKGIDKYGIIYENCSRDEPLDEDTEDCFS